MYFFTNFLGTYEELVKNDNTFAEYLKQYLTNPTSPKKQETEKFMPRFLSRTISERPSDGTNISDSKLIKRSLSSDSSKRRNLLRQNSISSSMKNDSIWDFLEHDIIEEVVSNHETTNHYIGNNASDLDEGKITIIASLNLSKCVSLIS